MNEVYVVQMIESESGWGKRPDGYLAFMNQESADAYVLNETKDRKGPAPAIYVQYHSIGRKPCSSDFLLSLIASKNGRLYVDRLEEMFWTQEQRAKKYTT